MKDEPLQICPYCKDEKRYPMWETDGLSIKASDHNVMLLDCWCSGCGAEWQVEARVVKCTNTSIVETTRIGREAQAMTQKQRDYDARTDLWDRLEEDGY